MPRPAERSEPSAAAPQGRRKASGFRVAPRARDDRGWSGPAIGYDRFDRRVAGWWHRFDRRLDGYGVVLVAGLAVIGGVGLVGSLARPPQAGPAPEIPALAVPAPEPRRKEQAALTAPVEPVLTSRYFELLPPYEVVDAVTIKTPLLTVRLAYVDGPGARAVCTGEDGRLWACGLRGRAALHNLVRQSTLRCSALPTDQSETEARCDGPNGDLAGELVLQGWARPIGPELYGPAVEAARAEKRGLWNGDWTVRP